MRVLVCGSLVIMYMRSSFHFSTPATSPRNTLLAYITHFNCSHCCSTCSTGFFNIHNPYQVANVNLRNIFLIHGCDICSIKYIKSNTSYMKTLGPGIGDWRVGRWNSEPNVMWPWIRLASLIRAMIYNYLHDVLFRLHVALEIEVSLSIGTLLLV